MISEFGRVLREIKPLVIVGYNLNRFDLPILLAKTRRVDALPEWSDCFWKNGKYSQSYWAIRDVMQNALFIDMMDPVRFAVANWDHSTPRMISLKKAIAHKRFSHLPFLRTKDVISNLMASKKLDKWQAIHRAWENDRGAFTKYITGDSHDVLLLTEYLFGISTDKPTPSQLPWPFPTGTRNP